ncbi:MAG: ferritin-like domain-containing protein, partial [Candidatus Paceibacterota bacterium]
MPDLSSLGTRLSNGVIVERLALTTPSTAGARFALLPRVALTGYAGAIRVYSDPMSVFMQTDEHLGLFTTAELARKYSTHLADKQRERVNAVTLRVWWCDICTNATTAPVPPAACGFCGTVARMRGVATAKQVLTTRFDSALSAVDRAHLEASHADELADAHHYRYLARRAPSPWKQLYATIAMQESEHAVVFRMLLGRTPDPKPLATEQEM